MDDDPLKKLGSQISALPTLPAIYVELEAQLNADDVSMAKVGQVVANDPGISAKLMQLANSSSFGRNRRVFFCNPSGCLDHQDTALMNPLV